MNTEYGITEELKSMGSVLADLPRTMPYAVPDGYFNNFHGSVQHIISDLDKADIVPVWGKTLPYSVPEGYFEALAQNILMASALSGLPKDAPYSIPAGYFQSLPAQMLQAAKAAARVKETRGIPLKRRTIWRQARLAAAAILILAIGIGSYNVFYDTQEVSSTDKILASVPNNEIQDYLQPIYRMDMDRVASNNSVNNLDLDNKDIIQYLNETGWD